MTEVGNIVTLEDNLEYLVIQDLTKDGVRYLYAVRVLIDETPTDEYIVFVNIVKDGEEYLKPVDDKAKYDELLEELKDELAVRILNEEV